MLLVWLEPTDYQIDSPAHWLYFLYEYDCLVLPGRNTLVVVNVNNIFSSFNSLNQS